MKDSAIKNLSLEQYKKKYKKSKTHLYKFSKKEVLEFDKKNNTVGKNSLLKNRKWALIGDTYYEIPKAVRPMWFSGLPLGVKLAICITPVVAIAAAGASVGIYHSINNKTVIYNATLLEDSGEYVNDVNFTKNGKGDLVAKITVKDEHKDEGVKSIIVKVDGVTLEEYKDYIFESSTMELKIYNSAIKSEDPKISVKVIKGNKKVRSVVITNTEQTNEVVYGNKLHFTAKCYPEEAKQDVSWSIYRKTSHGNNSIDQNSGEFSANYVENVTVVATAMDGSGVQGFFDLKVKSPSTKEEFINAYTVLENKFNNEDKDKFYSKDDITLKINDEVVNVKRLFYYYEENGKRTLTAVYEREGSEHELMCSGGDFSVGSIVDYLNKLPSYASKAFLVNKDGTCSLRCTYLNSEQKEIIFEMSIDKNGYITHLKDYNPNESENITFDIIFNNDPSVPTMDKYLNFEVISEDDATCSVKAIYDGPVPFDLVIPSTYEISSKQYTVTEIASNGFNGFYEDKTNQCTFFKSIKLPNTLTKINSFGFNGCSKIESIDLSNCTSLNSIEDFTFCWCTSLSEIKLPDNLKVIGNAAFEHCVNLKTINIPKNVESIYDTAFKECGAIENVTFGDDKAVFTLFKKGEAPIEWRPCEHTNAENIAHLKGYAWEKIDYLTEKTIFEGSKDIYWSNNISINIDTTNNITAGTKLKVYYELNDGGTPHLAKIANQAYKDILPEFELPNDVPSSSFEITLTQDDIDLIHLDGTDILITGQYYTVKKVEISKQETSIWSGSKPISWGDSNLCIEKSVLDTIPDDSTIKIYGRAVDMPDGYHCTKLVSGYSWKHQDLPGGHQIDFSSNFICRRFVLTQEVRDMLDDDNGRLLIVGYGYEVTNVTVFK